MPDWISSLIGPAVGGFVSGLMILAGLRVEVRALNEKIAGVASSAARIHVRFDDHIDRHHIGRV